jgi:hypothetical protein
MAFCLLLEISSQWFEQSALPEIKEVDKDEKWEISLFIIICTPHIICSRSTCRASGRYQEPGN